MHRVLKTISDEALQRLGLPAVEGLARDGNGDGDVGRPMGWGREWPPDLHFVDVLLYSNGTRPESDCYHLIELREGVVIGDGRQLSTFVLWWPETRWVSADVFAAHGTEIPASF